MRSGYFDKLVTILSALDKDDIKQLDDYVHSPYFNLGSAPIALFDYIITLYPDFPEHRLEPEVIARKSESLPTAATQRTAGTRLLKAVEHFIAVQDWQSNEMNVAWHQFHAMQQLQLLGDFEQEFDKVLQKINSDPEQDVDAFFNRHRFTELASNSFDTRLNRTIRNEIFPTIETLEAFYAIKLLRYMCEAFSRKRVLGTGYDETHLVAALKILEPYTNEKYPYVYLFVNVYKMLAAGSYEMSEPHYTLIKQFIAAQSGDTLPASCIESMSYVINWCLYWNRKGYETTSDEYLWWTDLKIKYNLLLESGKLLPVTFRNIVALAVSSNRPSDWMQRFIKQYSPCLPEEYRNAHVAFAKGMYCYRIKNFTGAIQFFMTAQAKEDVTFNANIRQWQYICTYEQNAEDIDLLLNQLQSFDKYIKRNEVALHQRKTDFLLFIYYAKASLDLIDRNERTKVRESLEKEAFFPAKPWLLQKMK